jgi:hypothetical protein
MGLAAAAAITATAAIGGGVIASNASKKASKAQVQASQDANAAQERMFQKQMELQEPFRQGGMTAQNEILQLLGIGGDKTAAGYGSRPDGGERGGRRRRRDSRSSCQKPTTIIAHETEDRHCRSNAAGSHSA